MSIWISSLALAPSLVDRHRPSRVVSLLSPYDTFPSFAALGADSHLQVAIHDITEDTLDWRAPDIGDAERLIGFVETWDRKAPMLIHCWAGISRSTASAFITACVHNPSTDEAEIAGVIRAASKTASPNRRLVAHADDILGRGGRMKAAIEAMGRGHAAEEAQPFSIPSSYGEKK
jgi:predicted protein tyrosine phosphatase